MKKIRFGNPEKIVPSLYCKNFNYRESEIKYDVSKISFKETARGCLLELPLLDAEGVYGFGLQLKSFNHKGNKLLLRANSDPCANTGDSHAPVPFFVTTEGYGIYIDTARYVETYVGYGKCKSRPKRENNSIITTAEDLYLKCGLHETTVMAIEIPVARGVDIYIIEGENITEIVKQYNMLSGGGPEVADWGFETIYRCYAKNTDEDVMRTADYFKERELPIGIIGLEPGWQSSSYSCSYVWDNERFPNHLKMIEYLRGLGYHINLWEHAFVNSTSPIYEALHDYSGDFEVWQGLVPDFATDEAKRIFADYHRDALVKLGIDGFKLDECDNSDFVHDWSFPNCAVFPSGMDGEQYHQMFGTLYMQTIMQALGETKTLSEVRNAGALAAPYPFVLYSDLYNHRDFIRGVVNSGFSGILWTPEVRDAKTKKSFIRRLQTVVFSVQSIINAWYCPSYPWESLECEGEVRELLQTRLKLIPMLKRAFSEYKNTGKPPVRALVMDYTSDKNTYSIDDEYIFCDKLLVAPIADEEPDERTVYLPEGKWRFIWTGEVYSAGYHRIATEKIPVFEKAD